MTKILITDIETRPALAYIWRMFDETIGLDQLLEPSSIISVGAKWLDKPGYFYRDVRYKNRTEVDPKDRVAMLRMLHGLWSQADAIVTFNGDKFDLPKLTGEFLQHGLPPPPPVASIDVRKTTSNMGFTSGRLAHVAPLILGEENQKIDTGGFKLWREYLDGDKTARAEMRTYNIRDVDLLERLYVKVRPFIKTHPYIGEKAEECPHCGSKNVQQRGRRRTRSFWITRLQCQDCGAWSSGTRKKIS